jgi:tetratricopeptide (TPR) repeat protein
MVKKGGVFESIKGWNMAKLRKKPPLPSKVRVIAVMNQVKIRLSEAGVDLGVGKDEGTPQGQTLIDRINQRDITVKLSGSRFDDMFMSRPERMVNARPEELVAVFESILKVSPNILPATELLELCALMRVPITVIQRFVPYYTIEEWREAVRPYQLLGQFVNDMPLVGREHEVAQVQRFITQCMENPVAPSARHLVLSGPSGVGKSAVVLHMIAQLSPLLRDRVRFVYLDEYVVRNEDVYRAIGQAYDLRPRGNETWQMLVRDHARMRQAVVIIDNLLDSARLSVEAMLQELRRTLYETHVVVTTQVAGLSNQIADVEEITLAPLDLVASRDLFWRVREQVSAEHLTPEQVDAAIAQAKGYPMQIIAVANGMQLRTPQPGEPPHTFIAGVPPEALRIMQLLMIMAHPVRLPLLMMLRPLLAIADEVTLRSNLWLLERRQLLSLRRPYGYLVHDAVRHTLRAWIPNADYQQLLVQTGQFVAFFADPDDLEQHAEVVQLQSHEITAIYEILVAVSRIKEYALVASCIIAWRSIWIRHGLTAEILALGGDCLPHLAETDPNYAMLLFAMGSFYGHRGIVDSTVRSLQMAMDTAERQSLALIWAKAALEMALHGIQAIGWRESERLLMLARATFERIGSAYYLARCHDMMAYIYLIGGEIKSALQSNDAAIRFYVEAGPSFGAADAYSNRGIIYMAMGDYEMARHELIKSEHIFQDLNAPANLAAVHLRIAAVHALANHAADARFYLVRAFKVIERIGGLNDVLYVVDIFAGVVLSEGKKVFARQVSDACSQARQHYGLPRGAALDAIVKRQLEYAVDDEGTTAPPPLSSRIADLLDVVRSDLLGR